jgi:hypothetical protein
MGEALIVRRGGGGGLGEATFVERVYGGSSSTVVIDPAKTYLLISARADRDSVDSIGADGGAYLLKDGVVSMIADRSPSFISYISYYPTTNRITLDRGGNDCSIIDVYELS